MKRYIYHVEYRLQMALAPDFEWTDNGTTITEENYKSYLEGICVSKPQKYRIIKRVTNLEIDEEILST